MNDTPTVISPAAPLYDRRETRILPGHKVLIVDVPSAVGFIGTVIILDCQRFPGTPVAVFFGDNNAPPSAEDYRSNPEGFPTVQCFASNKMRVQSR